MSIYKEFKRAFATAVDVIVDKTTTQAQKSRLVTVMKNEEKIANQIYVELGKYLYNNLRETMPDEVEQLCVKLDESKERMSRAQQIYREVIQQELVNREISRSEAKENFQRIKEPIVAKAKDTAVKVKDSAKDTAARVSEIKNAAVEKAEDFKNKSHKSATAEDNIDKSEEKIENAVEKTDVKEDKMVEPIVTEDVEVNVGEVLTVGEGLSDNVEVIENAIFSDSSLGEDSASEEEEPREIFSFTSKKEEHAAEAEDVEESFVPETKAVDQEFQRNMPVDIISENEFEEGEPEVKPAEKNTPFTKAMKLKNIITKKTNEED